MSAGAARPARIGLVIGQLSVGGAEGQLSELVRGLNRGEFRPFVYCLTAAPGFLRARLEESDVPVRVIGAVGWPRARRLARMFKQDRIDLIHSMLFIANTYAWVARRIGPRRPLVTSARNCKSQGAVHHAVNMAAFRASRAIIVNSRQVGRYVVRRYAAPRRRIRVVYNGVDADRFRPCDHKREKALTVLTAGRFVKQKNPFMFVEAAAHVRRELPNVRFVMAGDGPLRSAAADRARALGLAGGIEFAGECECIERLMGKADVFWLSSRWEGLPNVVLEAMACGLPVVATDVGGTRELFRDGQEGFLVRSECVADLVARGTLLLRDAALLEKMGRAARDRALEFSPQRMVAGTEAVYRAAVEGMT